MSSLQTDTYVEKIREALAKKLADRAIALEEKKEDIKADVKAEKQAVRENAEKSFAYEREKLEIQRIDDENKSRKIFSDHIFVVTVIWMFLILCVVISAGCGNLKFSDTVLVTLITTTTANVFGFLYVVVNYLFNKNKST